MPGLVVSRPGMGCDLRVGLRQLQPLFLDASLLDNSLRVVQEGEDKYLEIYHVPNSAGACSKLNHGAFQFRCFAAQLPQVSVERQ